MARYNAGCSATGRVRGGGEQAVTGAGLCAKASVLSGVSGSRVRLFRPRADKRPFRG